MRHTSTLLGISLLLLVGMARATEPGPEQLESAAWWRQQAVRYAGEIDDADSKGRAHYELVYVLTRADDLDGAIQAILPINKLQLRIYSITALARKYKEKGDDKSCRAALEQAENVALAREEECCHSYAIDAYMELGQPADAIELAAKVPNIAQRSGAYQTIAAKLVRQGKLKMAYDFVEKQCPPGWKESCCSVMANACADEVNIDEALKLAARLETEELQNRVFEHIVQALVRTDRAAEAGQFADRISDVKRRSIARGHIAAKLAAKESAEALRSRIEKAATREEKLELYTLLFTRLVDSGDAVAAEAAIDAMVKTVQSSPREAEASKFGRVDDTAVLAMIRSKYLAVAMLLAKKGDSEGSEQRMAWARKAVTGLSNEAGIGKSLTLMEFVHGEIAIGDFKGARATLEQLEKGFQRSSLAGPVAEGLIRSGDVKSGLEVVELITPSIGSGDAIGHVTSALIFADELKAASTLLQKVGDGRDDVRAFQIAGQNMATLGHLAELHSWVGELKSSTARAYLCMGAAETLQSLNDEVGIAQVWIERLKNKHIDISEVLPFVSSEFNIDGRLSKDSADIRREMLKLREILQDTSMRILPIEKLSKSQMAKYMANSKHSIRCNANHGKIAVMVLFRQTSYPPTGEKNIVGVHIGFDSDKKIAAWFD
jgi:hypothetical protein